MQVLTRKPYWWVNGFSISVFFMTIAMILTYVAPPGGGPIDPFYPVLLWIGSIFGSAITYKFRSV